MNDLIDTIREENIEWYGQCVLQPGGPEWGKIFTEKLYSKKTHFIFELLQNAEDACERKRKITGKERFKINFKLTEEGLEVRHNGILFDEDDIKSICYIGRGTKEEDVKDVRQIGKFGIGFKSVYAYTSSPHVYSNDYAFRIENLVLPYSEEMREDCKDGENLFYIPFNHKRVTPERAYNEIGKRLKNLGLRTLLFLRNVSEITWEINGEYGNYLRKCEYEEGFRWVTLYQDKEEQERWLVFKKQISDDTQGRAVEVAYLLTEDGEKGKIVKAKDTPLVVYFPTEKETRLHFLIQGPYNTTATRENIEADEWNEMLIEETGNLVAETITEIKSLEMLDVSFLNTLPIKELFSDENNLFKPIYDKVKDKLSSEEELLPAHGGGYISAKNAVIGRSNKLIDLLSPTELRTLFDKRNWIDGNITESGEFQKLWGYLTETIGIKEIRPENFAIALNKKFIQEQSDDWIKKFYAFLLEQKALWRKKRYPWKENGILRSKPIIRLSDNTHTLPFDEDKALAYLPTTDKNINRLFLIVKGNIANDSKAKEFLQNLGLKKPDDVAGIIDRILPKYQKGVITVNDALNIQHVEWIAKTLKKYSTDDRTPKVLEEKLKETPFLWANNIANSRSGYKKPVEIYLDEIYTKKKDAEIFFEGNEGIWLLDERYKDVADISILSKMGCKIDIYVRFGEADRDGNVRLKSYYHKRGLDGFDPDSEIEGLEHALKNITSEKAKIIWNILKTNQNYKRIYGWIEKSSHQDFSEGGKCYEKDEIFSEMGDLLIKYSWLPDQRGDFHTPSEILLSDLPDEFDKTTVEARTIAEKLKFRTEEEERLLEKLPPEKRERYELVDKFYERYPEEKAKKMLEKLIKQNDFEEDVSEQEMANEFKESLVCPGKSPAEIDTQDSKWTGLTSEEEEKIRKEYGDKFPKRLNGIQTIKSSKVTNTPEIVDSIDPKEFLLEQYDGHCQICNTRLDLGPHKKPYFEIFRIKETRGRNKWTDMEFNVLCLCPNCHALMKHGDSDLARILETAKSVSEGDIVPEPVDERKGDFYIVKIKVMGKEKELFYSSAHMNKVAAFIKVTEEKDDECDVNKE